MSRGLMSCIGELRGVREILFQLTRQQLILRYRRTLLGYFWTLINPLLMMTVMALVFSTLFEVELRSYVVFLFSGVIGFNFFQTSVVQASRSLVLNEDLLKKVYIPKMVFPTSVALATLVDSLFTFVVLMTLVLFIGGEASTALLAIPFSFLLLLFFSLGIALVVSIVTVYFRDIEHILTIGMQALFFLSPILYDKEKLFAGLWILPLLNPLVVYIELFRAPIFHATWPSVETWLLGTTLAALSMTIGVFFFCSQQAKVIFRL